jgi:hypothetical protein
MKYSLERVLGISNQSIDQIIEHDGEWFILDKQNNKIVFHIKKRSIKNYISCIQEFEDIKLEIEELILNKLIPMYYSGKHSSSNNILSMDIKDDPFIQIKRDKKLKNIL